MKSKHTQYNAILAHLQAGGTLTPIAALEWFGCNRLAARIREMRKNGIAITSNVCSAWKGGPRIAHYKMEVAP